MKAGPLPAASGAVGVPPVADAARWSQTEAPAASPATAARAAVSHAPAPAAAPPAEHRARPPPGPGAALRATHLGAPRPRHRLHRSAGCSLVDPGSSSHLASPRDRAGTCGRRGCRAGRCPPAASACARSSAVPCRSIALSLPMAARRRDPRPRHTPLGGHRAARPARPFAPRAPRAARASVAFERVAEGQARSQLRCRRREPAPRPPRL
jgi:hypothetical protein